jgi:hypothetical protein
MSPEVMAMRTNSRRGASSFGANELHAVTAASSTSTAAARKVATIFM